MQIPSPLTRAAAPVCLLLGLAVPAVAQGGAFQVAGSPLREASITADFDGVHYLVGIQGDGVNDSTVGAQFVSQTGTLVGGFLSTGRTGGVPLLDFGNGKHLLAWTDDASNPDNHIFGQLISPAGLQSTPFPISQALGDEDIGGVAAGIGGYLVTYYRVVDAVQGLGQLYGRIVSTTGQLRPEFQISTGFTNYGQGNLNNVAFDGSSYFVVWVDGQNDTEVRGRVISASGVPGVELSVHAGPGRSDLPLSLAFDGNNYLVVWTEEGFTPGPPELDVLGQRVAPGGALVGGVLPICTDPGDQYAPFVASTGGVSVVSWTDLRQDLDGDWACDGGEGTCADIHVRYLDAAGAPLADPWPVVDYPADQYGSPVVAGAGQFLLVWNDGAFPPPTLGGDVHGLILPTGGFPTSYCTAKLNSAGCLPAISASGFPTVTGSESFEVRCSSVLNNTFGLLFYGFAPGNVPFQGGALCVAGPLVRTPVQFSGGNPVPSDCSGSYSFDFNAWSRSGADQALVSGTSVFAQYWYRDPVAAVFPTGISDGLSFVFQP